QRIQRTHGRLATRAGALDAHFDGLDAVFLRGATGPLGSDLGRIRSGLARTAKTRATGRGPGQGIALAIGNGDDGVVEGSLHVGHRIGDHATVLLLALYRFSHDLKYPGWCFCWKCGHGWPLYLFSQSWMTAVIELCGHGWPLLMSSQSCNKCVDSSVLIAVITF